MEGTLRRSAGRIETQRLWRRLSTVDMAETGTAAGMRKTLAEQVAKHMHTPHLEARRAEHRRIRDSLGVIGSPLPRCST